MINRIYLHLPHNIEREYNAVFAQKSDKKIFKFLRKYLKHIECEDNDFYRYFTMKDPLVSREETQTKMTEFNAAIGAWLDEKISQSNDESINCELTCYLGVAHEFGIFGKPCKPATAFYYYTVSAQLRSDIGTFRLARCYESGFGTARNPAKAVYFYRCAAKHGLLDSMHVYGVILLEGLLGIPSDEELGLHFLSCAAIKANNIYPHALYDLGNYYESRDSGYALQMYESGSALVDTNCTYRLARAFETGDLEGIGRQPEKAQELYKLAAKLGHVDALIRVSEMYTSGIGNAGVRLPAQAFVCVVRAATKRNGFAAYIAGDFASKGFGVKTSPLHALWWFGVSRELGYDEADEKITELQQCIEKTDEGPFQQSGCCNMFC